MHVLFKRRPNSTAIYCRITVNGIHATLFSTFIKVPVDQWDQKAQRILGDSLASCDNNMRLDQIKSDITRLFLQDNELSSHELAALYLQKDKVIFYFSDIVDLFEKDCRLIYRNPETLRSYLTRIGNVRAFIEDRKINKMQAFRISLSIAHDFVRFMRERNCSHPYISRNIYVLKNITSNAASREILKLTPYSVSNLRSGKK
ncbi:phage integrase SAM-like domain-containing protein [Larkinella sp. GY13]|uniref:phage integrase SAM-like domain-containing protein n=1 Tax=Larkinella sp. GY13 TaxID=3453720 RepID=UPI003EE9392B